ncbi:hypothetical protein [Bradyrhizobium archetypum]|nr:hypothetical protein [Bradyrhizobium archetypum]
MTDQAHQSSVQAWREARDKMRPGSKEWKDADAELKKAEAEQRK